MPDNIGQQPSSETDILKRELIERQAENAALQHEIFELHKSLELSSRQHMLDIMPERGDPFGNPTEYRDFSGDYIEILPSVNDLGFKMPLEPDLSERRRLKKSYAIGGGCLFLRFFASNWLASLLILFISSLLVKLNPQADGRTLISYMKGSSIFASVNMIVYMVANVLTAFLGLKLARVRFRDIVKTRDYSFGKALQYCMISVFLLLISVISSDIIEDVFTHYGSTTNVLDMDGVAVTSTGMAILLIYRCIIAPVTEELFFRGMLLKTFSRANQRFAIFATAIFFGLAHSNIPQFILAFIVGIFLAHITMKHNSIVPAMVVHVFVNSFTSLPQLLGLSGASLGAYNMIFVLLAALGAVMYVAFSVTDRLPSTTPAQSRRGLSIAATTFFVAAAFWIQVLYLLSFLVDNPFLNSIRQIF